MTLTGRTSPAALATPDRSTAFLIGIGALGCALALAAGTAAASGYGVLVAGVLLALAVCGAAVAIFVRDPVRALIWLWIAVVLNVPLTTLAGGEESSAGTLIRYSDEVLVLLLVSLTAWWTTRTNTRIPLRYILSVLALALCGLLGAAIHHVPLGVTILGTWLGLKLWIMIGVALLLPWSAGDLTRVYRVLTTIGVIVAGLGFLEFLTNGAILDALHLQGVAAAAEDPRANAVHSIFDHPQQYSLIMSMFFAIAFARFAGTRSQTDLALALFFAGSVLLSLRLKGFLSLIAVVVVVAIVVLAQRRLHGRSAISIALIGSLLVVGAYGLQANVITTTWSTYTSSDQDARAQLYRTGERIAVDNFPLGVGFGRFGSYASRQYYSPVYDQYGLSSVWGLSRADRQFIDDTAWPSVMGETGYAGLVAYGVGIILLIAALIRRLRTVDTAMWWVPLAALCALVVILTDSIASPAPFDWLPAATFALILGPAMIATRTSQAPPETQRRS